MPTITGGLGNDTLIATAGGDVLYGDPFPPGTPQNVVDLATSIFHKGFVDAMRVTLWLPIAVLAVGALSVLLVKSNKKSTDAPAEVGETSAVA